MVSLIEVDEDNWMEAAALSVGKDQERFLDRPVGTELEILENRQAEAFYRKTLDPAAEAEIYAGFDRIVGDKTAVYISHRLSSCRLCHRILVFHEGRIVRAGTHQELLADEKGKYYELWHAQARYYA